MQIAPAEFDEVTTELGRTLDSFKVPKREKGEVLPGAVRLPAQAVQWNSVLPLAVVI